MEISEKQQSEQLGYLHELYRDNLKMRATIKNWCIIIWSGIIVIILTQRESLLQHIQYPIKSLILLLFFPILFFWLLETIEGGRTRLYRDILVDMENRIFNKKLEIKYSKDFFVMGAYQKTTICQKFFYFVGAFICSETLFSFYIPLCLASGILILAVKIFF